jgi:hypothetical protein
MDIHSVRTSLMACVGIASLAACAGISSTDASTRTAHRDREQIVNCRRPHSIGGDCSVEQARTATLAELRALGDSLTVDCGTDGDDAPDEAYKQACVRDVQSMAEELSRKWSANLAPIDVDQIRYDWTGFSEFDVVSNDGRCCIGVDNWWGEATIPLRWRGEPAAEQ